MNFDTLVLSSGGINSISTLGALQYLYDTNIITNINTFVGSSVGVLIAYLMSIGAKPSECISNMISSQMLVKLNNPNFLFLLKKDDEGIFNFNHIDNYLTIITLKKIGKLLTLKELYDTYGKTLITCTYNLTKDSLEYISHQTHPDLPCLIAVRMACSAPIFFGDFYYNGEYYTDGAVMEYFPIDIPEIKNKNIIAITTRSIENSYKKLELNTIFDYLDHIFSIGNNTRYADKIKNAFKEKNIKIITLNQSKLYWAKFNVSSKFILEQFSYGYTITKNLNCI
jgi:predicted acylesterase/phospholipase RssA